MTALVTPSTIFGCSLQEIVSYASILSAVISIVAFPLILRQLRAANVANGLSTLNFLQESIHKIGGDLKDLNSDPKITSEDEWKEAFKSHIEHIMNVLESGCLLILARSFTGTIKTSIIDSIEVLLDTLNRSEASIVAIRKSISSPMDYSNVRRYISETNRYCNLRIVLSDQLIIPPNTSRYMPWLSF